MAPQYTLYCGASCYTKGMSAFAIAVRDLIQKEEWDHGTSNETMATILHGIAAELELAAKEKQRRR